MSVTVFSTKVLIWDTIFTSPTGDGTTILRDLPSQRRSSHLQGKSQYVSLFSLLSASIIHAHGRSFFLLLYRPLSCRYHSCWIQILLGHQIHRMCSNRRFFITTCNLCFISSVNARVSAPYKSSAFTVTLTQRLSTGSRFHWRGPPYALPPLLDLRPPPFLTVIP